MMPWTFARCNREFEVAVTGPVIVNDFHAMMVAVSTGVAMGMIAEPTAKALAEAGELELLLTDHAATTSGLFLYYPSRKQVMPKLRAFISSEEHPSELQSLMRISYAVFLLKKT